MTMFRNLFSRFSIPKEPDEGELDEFKAAKIGWTIPKGWKLKIKKNPAGKINNSLIAPDKTEFTDLTPDDMGNIFDFKVRSPRGISYSKGDIAVSDRTTSSDVDNLIKTVFPKYEPKVVKDWQKEKPDEFLRTVQKQGRNETTERLIKGIYPDATDQDLEDLFPQPSVSSNITEILKPDTNLRVPLKRLNEPLETYDYDKALNHLEWAKQGHVNESGKALDEWSQGWLNNYNYIENVLTNLKSGKAKPEDIKQSIDLLLWDAYRDEPDEGWGKMTGLTTPPSLDSPQSYIHWNMVNGYRSIANLLVDKLTEMGYSYPSTSTPPEIDLKNLGFGPQSSVGRQPSLTQLRFVPPKSNLSEAIAWTKEARQRHAVQLIEPDFTLVDETGNRVQAQQEDDFQRRNIADYDKVLATLESVGKEKATINDVTQAINILRNHLEIGDKGPPGYILPPGQSPVGDLKAEQSLAKESDKWNFPTYQYLYIENKRKLAEISYLNDVLKQLGGSSTNPQPKPPANVPERLKGIEKILKPPEKGIEMPTSPLQAFGAFSKASERAGTVLSKQAQELPISKALAPETPIEWLPPKPNGEPMTVGDVMEALEVMPMTGMVTPGSAKAMGKLVGGIPGQGKKVLPEGVLKAAREGKPIPPEVLKEFPELAKEIPVTPKVIPVRIENGIERAKTQNIKFPVFTRQDFESLPHPEVSTYKSGDKVFIWTGDDKAVFIGQVADDTHNTQIKFGELTAEGYLKNSGKAVQVKTAKMITPAFDIEPTAISKVEPVTPTAPAAGARTQDILTQRQLQAEMTKELGQQPSVSEAAQRQILEGKQVKPLPQAPESLKKPVGEVTAGIPPEKPPVPPQSITTSPIPEQPQEIDRIISMAKAQVKQDRPGTINRFFQRIPGIKQIMQFERPGLKMTGENENILVAMVAERQARSDVGTTALGTQRMVIEQIEKQFSKEGLHGAQLDIKFLGTPEQAKSPLTGTIKDIFDNPELYQLDDADRVVIDLVNGRNDQMLDNVVQGYGAEIGRFEPKPGGAFLPNVDIGEDVIEYLGSETRAVATGRAKTRVWQTARERLAHDPKFKPELDIEKLVQGLDNFKASAAGGQAYRKALGGLTREEAMQKTHPALYAKMGALKKRLSSLQGSAGTIESNVHKAIREFLDSPIEGNDLANLREALDVKLKGGPRKGFDVAQVQDEIAAVREEIKNLKPAWEAANLRPYVFMQDGIFRYFPATQAKLIKESREITNNPLLNFIEGWRGGAFTGDVSPFAIQGQLGVLADPMGSLKAAKGALAKSSAEHDLLRSFKLSALASDIGSNPKEWGEYASLMGRDLSGTPKEYAAGFLSKIPKFDKFTEATYITVTRESFNLWKNTFESLMKRGVSEIEAKVAAANVASKIYPLVNPARLGQSAKRAAILRALPTSYSFIRQPASLIADATKAMGKIVARKPLTPSENSSLKLLVTMAGSVLTASATSAAISAKLKGKSDEEVLKDVWSAINPDPYNGRFAAIIIGDKRIQLGGPYRAIFRAIYPQEVKGVPFPVPFGGLPNYLKNRITPAVGTQIDLILNRDYNNVKIRQGKSAVEDFLRGIAYEIENALPLTAGTVVEGIRQGDKNHENILQQAAAQFMGVNMVTLDNTYVDRLAKTIIPGFINKLGTKDEEGLAEELKKWTNPAKRAEIEAQDWTYDIKDLRTDIGSVTSFLEDDAKAGAPKNMPEIVRFYWGYSEEEKYFKTLSKAEQESYVMNDPDYAAKQYFWGDWTDWQDPKQASLQTANQVSALASQYNIRLDLIPGFQKTPKGYERIPSDKSLWPDFFKYFSIQYEGKTPAEDKILEAKQDKERTAFRKSHPAFYKWGQQNGLFSATTSSSRGSTGGASLRSVLR